MFKKYFMNKVDLTSVKPKPLEHLFSLFSLALCHAVRVWCGLDWDWQRLHITTASGRPIASLMSPLSAISPYFPFPFRRDSRG